eukprot:1148565-Pelagomonas_calceolata.AAC.1
MHPEVPCMRIAIRNIQFCYLHISSILWIDVQDLLVLMYPAVCQPFSDQIEQQTLRPEVAVQLKHLEALVDCWLYTTQYCKEGKLKPVTAKQLQYWWPSD